MANCCALPTSGNLIIQDPVFLGLTVVGAVIGGIVGHRSGKTAVGVIVGGLICGLGYYGYKQIYLHSDTIGLKLKGLPTSVGTPTDTTQTDSSQ